MALTALGVGPGDEVIIPAYTFIATAAAVFHTGAVPVIVDIDPETYCIDPQAVEAAITDRTACIVPVHVAGNPCDMDAICEIAARHHLPVLEDAAQAHGAQWNGRGVGAIGDIGSFSFQSSKNLACGEGGALVTNNDFLANLVRAYADCGRFDGEGGPRQVLGWDFRMTEMQAALLLSQLKRLLAQAAQRDTNGLYLAERLQNISGIKPAKRDSRVTRHAYHLFMFSVDESVWGVSTRVFMEALRAEGIPCSAGYVPLYRTAGFVAYGQSCPSAWSGIADQLTKVDYGRMYLPVTEAACRNTVWLAQRLLLGSQADMDDIATAVEKLWHERAALQKVRPSTGGLGYEGL
jgi:dTDP-4-amino-4,6-dideoxygalactose transaminase